MATHVCTDDGLCDTNLPHFNPIQCMPALDTFHSGLDMQGLLEYPFPVHTSRIPHIPPPMFPAEPQYPDTVSSVWVRPGPTDTFPSSMRVDTHALCCSPGIGRASHGIAAMRPGSAHPVPWPPVPWPHPEACTPPLPALPPLAAHQSHDKTCGTLSPTLGV